MSVQNDGIKSFVAGAALAAYRAVTLQTNGTTVAYPALEASMVIGITTAAAASGDNVPVKLITGGGTFKVTVATAVTMAINGVDLYLNGTAGAGKFGTTDPGSGVKWFKAIQTASGDGAVIEAYPLKLG